MSVTPSLYGWLIIAAFALFVISLGSISEMTEAHLKAHNKKRLRP